MNDLIADLMRRENMTNVEVRDWILEATEGLEPEELEDVLQDEFGMEPDYIFDLINIINGTYKIPV